MMVFICGTGTNIGKTLVSSWLCLHMNYSYFKPIQTGAKNEKTDSSLVKEFARVNVFPESYIFQEAVSPHLAAELENSCINMQKIYLPKQENLIIEGAGGLFVPINEKEYIVDLIIYFKLPVILVCDSCLGTINHSLLSLQALRQKNINILGVIISGKLNKNNAEAIEYYGKVEILAQLNFMPNINYSALKQIKFSDKLTKVFSLKI